MAVAIQWPPLDRFTIQHFTKFSTVFVTTVVAVAVAVAAAVTANVDVAISPRDTRAIVDSARMACALITICIFQTGCWKLVDDRQHHVLVFYVVVAVVVGTVDHYCVTLATRLP